MHLWCWWLFCRSGCRFRATYANAHGHCNNSIPGDVICYGEGVMVLCAVWRFWSMRVHGKPCFTPKAFTIISTWNEMLTSAWAVFCLNLTTTIMNPGSVQQVEGPTSKGWLEPFPCSVGRVWILVCCGITWHSRTLSQLGAKGDLPGKSNDCSLLFLRWWQWKSEMNWFLMRYFGRTSCAFGVDIGCLQIWLQIISYLEIASLIRLSSVCTRYDLGTSVRIPTMEVTMRSWKTLIDDHDEWP